MRIPFLTFLLCFTGAASRAQGPYTALLAHGDTLTGKSYYTRGDTLGLPGTAKVLARDVVLFWTPKERWTFTYPGGRMKKIKEQGSAPCTLGHICAERFQDAQLPYDSLPIPGSWYAGDSVRECYRRRLEEHGVHTLENGDPLLPIIEEEEVEAKVEGNGGLPSGGFDEVIRSTGDTIRLNHYTYAKDSLLCWINGPCMPTAEVLMVRTRRGQFYYPLGKHKLIRLHEPVPDLSAASLGRVHARRLFGACLEWADVPIPDSLKRDPLFLRSYRAEVHAEVDEAIKRKDRIDAMRIVQGGLAGGLVGAGVAGAFIKPEDRPFWGTPMPPE